MDTKADDFPGIDQFLLGAGLYAPYRIDIANAETLFGGDWKIDGHCHRCHRDTVFSNCSSLQSYQLEILRKGKTLWPEITMRCARREGHEIWFSVFLSNGIIRKVGQWPALADIANDEVREYRKILGAHDSREFSRAIGLATHGVGIGSFVYLRRIFERLINSRFDQFKTAESWTDENFRRRRMEERIELLSDHLPDFLVRNRKIYGILSQGVHELDDDQCLAFFPVLRSSIIVILEEDKKKMDELARQAELERAITNFSAKPTGEAPSAPPPPSTPDSDLP